MDYLYLENLLLRKILVFKTLEFKCSRLQRIKRKLFDFKKKAVDILSARMKFICQSVIVII